MTTKLAALPRPTPASAARYLISAAVVAAIAGSALPQRAVAADEDALSEVTVTGSRIARSRDLEAPSPIATVSREAFENTSSSGAEHLLNSLPQFVPGRTQFTVGGSDIQASPTSNPGSATVNLRGLGPNRNLVLIDGRRPQPANATLAVDINTIPTSAIKSVEVITGGASAVYGPDAIAGVVNFVLKDDFQGVDVDVQRSQTFKSDGGETHVSALMGLNGAEGRGNVMVGIDWTKRDPVYQIDRDFYRNGWLDPGTPSGGFLVGPAYAPGAAPPSQAALDSIFPQAAPGTVGRATQINFNGDGTPYIAAGALGYNGPLNSLDPGRYTGMKRLTNGTLDQSFTQGYISVPLTRHSFFGRGTFNFTDDISAFTQVSYSNVDVKTRGGLPPAITIWQAQVPRYAGDPGLPASLVTLLNSRTKVVNGATVSAASDPWTLYQVLDYEGPVRVDNSTDVWQALAGLKGKLPIQDWTWEAYVSRGNTHVQADYDGLPSLQRYQYLVSLPNFGQGASVKSPAGTPFGYGVSCPTGLPVFQQFTPDPLCLQSIADPMKTETSLRQNIFEASVQGSAFSLPAGEVRFSFGVGYRKEEFSFSPGNPVGAITDNPVGLFASNYTSGMTDVKEAFTELLVPIIKKLDLELGYRYSDFNTAGGTNTWKALFTWKALDAVSFRGGFQAATRAPNVAELFTGPTQNVVPFPQEDPCSSSTLAPWGNVASNPNRLKVQALCRAIIGNSTSEFDTQTFNPPGGPNFWTRQVPKFFPLEIEVNTGNPKVNPETGRTWTLGTVISEPFGLSHFTATVDYYHIKMSDTIAPESSITVYNNCFNFNGQSNPNYDVTNPYCQLIHRDPITGDRATVVALYKNLGALKTQGVDLSVNWSHDLGPGQLSAGTAVNYLREYKYQTSPTSPLVDARGTLDTVGGAASQGGLYKWRANSHLGYSWAGLSVGLDWIHLPSIKDASASTNPTTTVLPVPAYDLFNLMASYGFDKYTVRFGIDNVLDKDSVVVGRNPGVTNAATSTNPGFYDPLGRRFYVGAKASF